MEIIVDTDLLFEQYQRDVRYSIFYEGVIDVIGSIVKGFISFIQKIFEAIGSIIKKIFEFFRYTFRLTCHMKYLPYTKRTL